MNTKLADAQNYLDINGLNNIRKSAKSGDKADKEAALEQAAKQFEAIFMQMLMKSMRQAQEVLESDSPFNSQSTKFYRDMHDQQMSLELSNNGSLGLSELIVRQLGGDSDNFKPHQIVRADGNIDSRQQMNSLSRAKALQASVLASNSPSQSQAVGHHSQNNGMQPSLSGVFMPSSTFNTPTDFVSALTPEAKKVQNKLNVPFEVVIAQAALETGWGKKIIKTANGSSSNNIFNIKADKRWSGDKAHKETLEFENGTMVQKREPFRVYQSISESVQDYINFLSSNDRYQDALNSTKNVEQFLHNLQKAGYATDPHYAKKIMATLKTVTGLLAK